ncbi:MAG: hypothetical protein L6R38_003278 [Xanthoria sp. 2 TBL-2021]|nr:MAG: hypothetical protein L6R38_003278 [Xanthoria sp. 2 TBL-2021]
MRTFTDAVKVTRQLGIRHLWIDSLCIIQDSEADWLHEYSLMSSVYKYSYCTIAATAAAGDDSGCFLFRDPQLALPVQFSFSDLPSQSPSYLSRIVDSAGIQDGTLINGTYTLQENRGMWFEDIENSPLFARAWVLQERLLSPRILHFAKSQLYWECREVQACESYPISSPYESDYTALGYSTNSPFNLQRSLSQGFTETLSTEACRVWQLIVEKYSDSCLTKERDKLVAVSAIAREMKPLMQCRYLAGHWEKDLVLQLCWDTVSSAVRPTTFRAPSWSWASVEGQCLFPTLAAYPRYPPTHMIEILSAHMDLASEDELGLVTGGHLDILGQLFQVDSQTGTWEGEGEDALLIHGLPTDLQLYRDDRHTKLDGPIYCMILLISNDFPDWNFEGLALQRIGSSNVYQRVGFIESGYMFNEMRKDPMLETLGFFEMGDDDTVTFVRNDEGRVTIRIV